MNFIPPSFDFRGNREKAISLKGQALSFYNHVSQQAEREGLQFINRSRILSDGSTISIVSKKESNYNNRVGKITIFAPSFFESIPSKGSSVYVTAAPTNTQRPKSAIFSFKSIHPITLNPIDTTRIFSSRFNQPYVPVIGDVYNAPEFEDISKGIPPVSRICNKVIYDSKGQPLVYTGIRETQIKLKAKQGISQISYQNVIYVGSNNKDNIVFDVVIKGTLIYALTGSNELYYNGGNLNLYVIDTSRGRLGISNTYDSVGYKIFSVAVVQGGFNLNYTADDGAQMNEYTYSKPYDTSRILDAKFAPEFLNTGEITILGKTRLLWYDDSCRITELTLNIVRDTERGDPLLNYQFPDNIVQQTYDHEASYIWEERTCPEFSKTVNNLTSATNVYFEYGRGSAAIGDWNIQWFSGPYPVDATPGFFAEFSVIWNMVDSPRDPYYYDDNVTSVIRLAFMYATGPGYLNSNGDRIYPWTTVYVPVGGDATASVYSDLGAPYEPYRQVQINNVTATLVNGKFEVKYDCYITINGVTFGWHCSNFQMANKPTMSFRKLTYKTIHKLWVDTDQYQICGVSYDTNKSSPDYNTKRYIYIGIKADATTSIEVTKTYKYHYINIDAVSVINLMFKSSTELATRFPEFAAYYTDTPHYEITEEPTKTGDITRHFYIGKTFADAIKIGDFGYNNAREAFEIGKTWKTTYKGVWAWKAMDSRYQNARSLSGYVPLYVFYQDHVYQEIDAKDVATADWSKDTYTSKRFYDSQAQDYLHQDTAGIYPEDNIGLGSKYQHYTSHTKYSVQIPITSTEALYYSQTPVAPPTYHGSNYNTKIVLQNYIYEDGTRRILNYKIVDEIASKNSTPQNIVAAPSDFNTITQASLTLAKQKNSRRAIDDSFPGHSIKFKISPDYTFYNINPTFVGYLSVTGLNSYVFEGASKTIAKDLTSLQTTTGVINQASISWTAYPCGYSY